MKEKPKICLSIEDGYADVYAMHTLYEYLVENNFDAEFKIYSLQVEHLLRFNKCIRESGVGEEFKSDKVLKVDERERWPDVILGGYADGNNYLPARPKRTISIDHSILKNCVSPTTKEQKKELRRKYKISNEKPVVVVGFPSGPLSEERHFLERIVHSLYRDFCLYLVGSINSDFYELQKEEANIVNSDGILRDYYAMADVALINRRLSPQDNHFHMHNFIEATAGGPLFLVAPRNTAQYGYKQLVEREVIREAKDTDNLIAKVKKYLQNPEEERVREQRTQHLEQSRNLYLPDILRLLNKVLGNSDESFQSDLLAEILPSEIPYFFRVYSPRIKVCHPQTLWDLSQTKPSIPLRNVPKKVYKEFRRKR